MVGIFRIDLEDLTPEAFRPYGAIHGGLDATVVFSNPNFDAWRIPFESDGRTEVMFTRYAHQPLRFTRLERHFAVSQGFIPVGGMPSVMVVAPPTDASDLEAVPTPTDVRAFLFEPAYCLILHRGTWHAPARFPVAPPHADFVLLTDMQTQWELEEEKRTGLHPELTQAVDLGARLDLIFEVADPRHLIPTAPSRSGGPTMTNDSRFVEF